MKRKCFKYIFIIMIAVFISFLNVNELHATSFCSEGLQRLYCEYKLDKDVTIIVKMDHENFSIESLKPNETANYRISVKYNLVQKNFNFPSETKKYRCLSELYYTRETPIGGGIGSVTNYYVYYDNQQKDDEGNIFSSYIKAKIGENCSSIIGDYASSLVACGNYGSPIFGSIALFSTKNQDGTFTYTGSLSVNGILKGSNLTLENFSFGGSSINSITGCPEKVCFKQTGIGGFTITPSTETSDCHYKGTDIKTGEEIEKDQNTEKTGFFDKWDKIPALLNGISEIKSGKLSCGSIGKVIVFMQKIFNLIKVAAFLLLIVFTAIDFTKAVSVSDDDAMKKALNKFVKRAMITVIIVILPSLINLILGLVAISGGTCRIS